MATVNEPASDLNRLVQRRQGTNSYDLTPDGPIGTVLFPIGQRVAIFHTKVHDRLLSPLLAADQPPPRYDQHWPPSTATSEPHRPRTPRKGRLKLTTNATLLAARHH